MKSGPRAQNVISGPGFCSSSCWEGFLGFIPELVGGGIAMGWVWCVSVGGRALDSILRLVGPVVRQTSGSNWSEQGESD